MGAKSSKILPYKDAVARCLMQMVLRAFTLPVEQEEFATLQRSFRRFEKADLMPRDSVVHHILSDILPQQYIDVRCKGVLAADSTDVLRCIRWRR